MLLNKERVDLQAISLWWIVKTFYHKNRAMSFLANSRNRIEILSSNFLDAIIVPSVMYWITKTFLKEWARISIGFLTWFDNPNLERVQKWLYHLLHHWIFEESGSKEKSIEIQMKKALNYFFSKARFFFSHKEGPKKGLLIL